LLVLPAAKRFFKKLKDKELIRSLKNALQAILADPFIGEQKTGDLKGLRCLDVYYNKTNYELAYRIEEQGEAVIVVVVLAGTRENFYKELKRSL
jgi:hypothetical protein